MSSAAPTSAQLTSDLGDTQSAVESVATESNVDANGVTMDHGANNGNGTKGPGLRRPDDVAIKQQRMKSWQPLLHPRYVIAAYFIIGIVFIPTGELRNDYWIEKNSRNFFVIAIIDCLGTQTMALTRC